MITSLKVYPRIAMTIIRAAAGVPSLLPHNAKPGRAKAVSDAYALITAPASGLSMDFSQSANSGYAAAIS